MIALAAIVLATPSQAQGNLDAGKSPARIFSDTCASCHKSARELKRTSAGYLRAHYTTGPGEANAMANYLAGVGNGAPEPRPSPQRQPPERQLPERQPAAGEPGPDLLSPPAATPPPPLRQPQAKAAQAQTGKKGRTVAEPKGSAPSAPAIIIDMKPPELPDPPPAAPAPGLEPFEE